MAHYGSTPTFIPRSVVAADISSRRRRGGAALIGVFVVLCCLSYASVQSQLSVQPLALEAQELLTPVAPLKISFDAKIGGADPVSHLNTFALSNVKLAGNPQWKNFANRAPPCTIHTTFASPTFSAAAHEFSHDYYLQALHPGKRGLSTTAGASSSISFPTKKDAG
jgi:hypothetical protein